MKAKEIFSFVILLLILTIQTAYTDWQQTNGPYGAPVRSLIANGTYLFAGMEETGIWVSSDNGMSWSPTIIATGRVRAFTIENNTIFGASISTVYKSSDNGVNWTQSQIPNQIINCMASNNSLILAGTQTYGIYASSNSGTSWIQTALNNKSIRSMCTKDNFIFAGTPNGIYVSANNGLNWQPGGLDTMSIGALYNTGSSILAGTSEDGIYKSTDNGVSWQHQINFTENVTSITSLGGNIFASTGVQGIYRSTDNGISWQNLPGSIGLYQMEVLGNNIFAVSPSKGVYRSFDNGLSWQQTPLINNSVSSFAAYGNFLFANLRGSTFSNGVHVSTDRGESWAYANISADAICSGGNYLFGTYNGQPRISRSTDNGVSWQSSGIINADGWISVIANGNNIFASHYIIQRSTDGGETWNIIPGISSAPLKCLSIGGALLFAALGTNQALYRSTNNGDNWSPSPLGFRANSIAINGSTVYAATQNNGIYISSNSGETWNQTALVPQSVSSVVTYGNVVFASTISGVCFSSNNGSSWQQINNGLPGSPAGELFISNDYIYAGILGRGVWKRPLSEVLAVQNISSEIPAYYSLYQNYPNPFNPLTNIKFSLPVSGFTTLDIYDINGRLISKLVRQELNAGTYTADFNASNFASGIYFYALASGDFIKTNRMVLVK